MLREADHPVRSGARPTLLEDSKDSLHYSLPTRCFLLARGELGFPLHSKLTAPRLSASGKSSRGVGGWGAATLVPHALGPERGKHGRKPRWSVCIRLALPKVTQKVDREAPPLQRRLMENRSATSDGSQRPTARNVSAPKRDPRIAAPAAQGARVGYPPLRAGRTRTLGRQCCSAADCMLRPASPEDSHKDILG